MLRCVDFSRLRHLPNVWNECFGPGSPSWPECLRRRYASFPLSLTEGEVGKDREDHRRGMRGSSYFDCRLSLHERFSILLE